MSLFRGDEDSGKAHFVIAEDIVTTQIYPLLTQHLALLVGTTGTAREWRTLCK